MKLKRSISKTNLLFLAIGSIIGSGWLFGSFYTAQIAGPAAILSWFLGGVIIAVIALTLAELSTMIPLSGGSVSYAALSHGKFCGAMFSWVTWLWTMAVAPIEVQAVMQYSSHYFPSILNPTTENLTPLGFVIATFLIFVLCFINFAGVKLMAETNKFISLWKIGVPIAIALILLTYHPHYENVTAKSFSPYGLAGILSSISTGGVTLSFFGFQTGIFLAGEAKNPQKSIPFALFGSLFVSMVIYCLLQLGFIVGLSPQSLVNGWSKISFVGDSGPFAGILIGLGLFTMAKLLYLDAVVSPLGTALGLMAASSRILYSMGLQKDAPSVVAKLNKSSIPWVAIVVNFFFGMIFFLPFSGWKEMASFLSAAMAVSLVCGTISLPVFRDKLAQTPRPYVLFAGKFVSFVSFFFCTLILYWTGFLTVMKFEICFAAILALFLFMYLVSARVRSARFHFKSGLWFVAYLVLCGVLSYIGPFGGLNLIGIKTSLVCVLALCFGINFIAQKTALKSIEIANIYSNLLAEHKETGFEQDGVNGGVKQVVAI